MDMLDVPCPVCNAPAGHTCWNTDGTRRGRGHGTRRRAALGTPYTVTLNLSPLEVEPLLWLVNSEYKRRGNFGRIVRLLKQAAKENES